MQWQSEKGKGRQTPTPAVAKNPKDVAVAGRAEKRVKNLNKSHNFSQRKHLLNQNLVLRWPEHRLRKGAEAAAMRLQPTAGAKVLKKKTLKGRRGGKKRKEKGKMDETLRDLDWSGCGIRDQHPAADCCMRRQQQDTPSGNARRRQKTERLRLNTRGLKQSLPRFAIGG